MNPMTRREMIGGLAAGGAALSLGSVASAGGVCEGPRPKTLDYKNSDFYAADGTFNAAAAKEAYYELMRSFDYPIMPRLHTDDFWALDFGLGNFMEVGMAGIFWMNNKKYSYFGHDIYLLPGQMIPEHKHVATDMPAKMEGWCPRHGFIYTYGEGDPTPGVSERIPPMHRDIAVARTEKILHPGDVAGLSRPEEKHWMRGGPFGAIVTEYATYHDMAGLRFTHPKAKL